MAEGYCRVMIRFRCDICAVEFSRPVTLPVTADEFTENIAGMRCKCGAKTGRLMILPPLEPIFLELTMAEFEERWKCLND